MLCVVFLTLCLAAPAAESSKKRFDLPADSAELSLKRFSKQAGIEVVFATQSTTGVRTPEVRGEFNPLEALSRLLAGTPLSARSEDDGHTILIDRENAPSPSTRTTASDNSIAPATNEKKNVLRSTIPQK